MSNWLLCGLLLALPLWSGQHQSSFPVALYTQFQHEPSAVVLQALQEEVETIMVPMGAEFEWRSLVQVTGNEVSSELAVVKFLGHCQPTGYDPHAATASVLGWTHVSDGAILPFSDINCDVIRNFLQAGLLAIDAKDREAAYGRAVARVLAHELYHIFANTVHHGSNGVGKAVYSVRDLLSHDFHFEERESEALRNTKPGAVAEIVDGTH